MHLFYAAFKLVSGIIYASFWYGADAIFYIVLSTTQFLMLRGMQKKANNMEEELQQYRLCGGLIFVLSCALVGVVYQSVHLSMDKQYPGLLIYVVATYAFFCLVVSIVNVIQYRKLNSPVLSAIKIIRLAKALVAIYALQAALLTTFGGDESESFKDLMRILTGGGVCLLIIVMAVYMVIWANQNLKRLRTE